MDPLARILKKSGVKTSSLALRFELDQDKVYTLAVPCEEVLAVWRKLRKLVPKTGCWPVLLGHPGAEDVPTERTHIDVSGKEKRDRYPSTEEILAWAEEIDAAQWFEQMHANHIQNLEKELEDCRREGWEEDAAHYAELLNQPVAFRGLPREPWPKDEGGILFEFIALDLIEDEEDRPISI